MKWFGFDEGRVGIGHAWTARSVRARIAEIFETLGDRLPPAGEPVVVKPNLNNDLPPLSGNATDLRVLAALLAILKDRGHGAITLADGSNVGMERRGIDGFRRLRVDRLARHYGARTVDLNRSEGREVALATGPTQVARLVLDAPFLIAVPKIKTHAEAGLSLSMKLWVGSVVAQHKRDVHVDLARNIAALGRAIRPHLILLDGLVGMEGNGPGDGSPFRMETLMASRHGGLLDVAAARVVDLPVARVPALVRAIEAGDIAADLPERVAAAIPARRAIDPAPPRGVLAPLSEHRLLRPLKLAVRPFVDHPAVSGTAYRLGVIQDRYSAEDDEVTSFFRREGLCTRCGRCEEACPMSIPWERIGAQEQGQRCISCLSCFWICPTNAIQTAGRRGFMEAHVQRYKKAIGRL